MKKQELKDLIDELQDQLDCRQKQYDAMPDEPKTVMDLQNGDEYYWISVEGNVWTCYWRAQLGCELRRNQGNIFLTRKKAKDESRRREIMTKLKRLAGGYEFVHDECNWAITLDRDMLDVGEYNIYKHIGQVYFATSKDAQNAIDTIGEDDLNFLFGV